MSESHCIQNLHVCHTRRRIHVRETLYTELTCVSYEDAYQDQRSEEEDTCVSYEQEDTSV
jgi:hypothetical protein